MGTVASIIVSTTLPLSTTCFTTTISRHSTSLYPTFLSTNTMNERSSCSYPLYMGGGGWGKRTKEFSSDEFAREGGDRRGFDAYELQERGDFLRRVRNDQSKFLKRRDEEYLEIAKMAGITDQVGDGVEPMGEFSVDDEYMDDLDVSVQWDDDDENQKNNDPLDLTYDPDASITRLDGDNDVSGALGQW